MLSMWTVHRSASTTLSLSVYRSHQTKMQELAWPNWVGAHHCSALSHMLDADLLYKYQTNRTLTHYTAWNIYIIHYLKHVQTLFIRISFESIPGTQSQWRSLKTWRSENVCKYKLDFLTTMAS